MQLFVVDALRNVPIMFSHESNDPVAALTKRSMNELCDEE